MTNISVSNNEDDHVPKANTIQYAVLDPHPSKQVRANSDLSSLIERHWVIAHSHTKTLFENNSSTRPSTPSKSQFDNSKSVALLQSNHTGTTTAQTRCERTQVCRAQEDPGVELTACIARVVKSTATACYGYKTPVMLPEHDGTVLYHRFECTKCGTGHMAYATSPSSSVPSVSLGGGQNRLL
ncbi:hypothetical protein BDV93DRAFT_506404 [Ceratobasidium sp. AG-I]|nr:hypothetical protein BDV93DRAFT_506404 [Ceratobasidium sp. AG-I]